MALPLLLLYVALLGLPQSAEHPVALAPDFDPAKCVECHADKQQGKFIHTAISAAGCSVCHQVETQGEKTQIKLTAPRAELCASCHEASKESNKHHPYAQNECLVCHDPHATEHKAQTRAPLNALCLECHGERPLKGATLKLFQKQDVPAEEFAAIPKIVLSRSQRVGHPFLEHPVTGGPDPLRKGEQFNCLTCHLPHAAPLPRLLPAAWRGAEICDTCHQAAKAEKAAKPGKPDSPEKPEKRQKTELMQR